MLERQAWRLERASDARGAPIAALFVAGREPLQLEFRGDRVAVANACNRIAGTWALEGERLQVAALMATKMACADPRVAALDGAISARLEGSSTLTLHGGGGAPRLELVTAGGDRLEWVALR